MAFNTNWLQVLPEIVQMQRWTEELKHTIHWVYSIQWSMCYFHVNDIFLRYFVTNLHSYNSQSLYGISTHACVRWHKWLFTIREISFVMIVCPYNDLPTMQSQPRICTNLEETFLQPADRIMWHSHLYSLDDKYAHMCTHTYFSYQQL